MLNGFFDSQNRLDYLSENGMDCLSFMRFLGLDLDSRIPDAKTIWLFRERSKSHNLRKTLFDQFNWYGIHLGAYG